MSTNLQYRIVEGDEDVAAPAPLADEERGVFVTRPLSDAGYRRAAGLMAGRAEMRLFINHPVEDLELLRLFPGLRQLAVRSLRLDSWDGLRHVADTLELLQVAETTLRPLSITPIGELERLTQLDLIGPVRDIEVISRLTGLTDLGLRSITLPDLSLLMPMRRLRALWLGLGGTSDLGLLPELAALDELELWRIRALRDGSMLGSMPGLRSLTLQSMSAVTELPSFRNATALRRVALDTMKGVTDLAPLAEAPGLEELLLIAMPQLDAESLRPFVGHPTLREGVWGFGSKKRNIAAYDLLPLGTPPFEHPAYAAWLERQRTDEADRSG